MKDVHRLSHFGFILGDCVNGCFMVHRNSESSFVVGVMFKQHLISLIKLKESFLGNLNESFSYRG